MIYECMATQDEINELMKSLGKEPVSKSLGFWNTVGGKLLALLLLPLFFGLGSAAKRGSPEEKTEGGGNQGNLNGSPSDPPAEVDASDPAVIPWLCPSCGLKHEFEGKYAGLKIHCPRCKVECLIGAAPSPNEAI